MKKIKNKSRSKLSLVKEKENNRQEKEEKLVKASLKIKRKGENQAQNVLFVMKTMPHPNVDISVIVRWTKVSYGLFCILKLELSLFVTGVWSLDIGR